VQHRALVARLAAGLAAGRSPARPAEAQPLSVVWSSPPPLSYFVLNSSLQTPLRLGARLTLGQFAQIQRIAEGEQAQLRRLLESSQPIVTDPALSLDQKRLYLQRTGYNRRVEAILYLSDRALRLALDPAAYARVVSWMDRRWPLEVRLHGQPPATLTHWLIPILPSWIVPLSSALPRASLKYRNPEIVIVPAQSGRRSTGDRA